MTTIQARRRLIVILLLCAAVAGAMVRHLAAPASLARDIGTLLMLLWLPVIGSVIGWLVGRVRRRGASEPPTFEAERVFDPQALVELTLRPSQVPSENTLIPEGEHRCALVVGSEAFSARWFVSAGQAFHRGTAQAVQVEFLTPAIALPRFPRETAFRMLVGETFVGDGRVLQVLG